MAIKRKAVAVVLIVAVLCTGYWFTWGRDDAVAVVNGRRIGSKELAARVDDFLAEYAGYGIEITAEIMAGVNEDALNELIAEILLAQAAEEAGISVSDEDVDAYYSWLAADYGGEDALAGMLRDMGYTVAGFRAEVARQMTVQRYLEMYIEECVDPLDLAVTEAEIQELYDYYAAQFEEMPPLEEVESYLVEELRNWKVQELQILDQIITELRAAAEIRLL